MQASTPLSQLAAEMLEGGRLYLERIAPYSDKTIESVDRASLRTDIDLIKNGSSYSIVPLVSKNVNAQCSHIHSTANILGMLYVFRQGLEESLAKPLEGRVEEMKKAQELTLHQIVTGGIPEMKEMIEAVVMKKLEALKLTPEQKAEDEQAKQPILDVIQIQMTTFQDVDSATSKEEKINKIQDAIAKITAIMKDFQAKTDAEKALERLVALVSECNKLQSS